MQTFKSYKLKETLLKSLERMGYEIPTPVQSKTLPVLLKNQDLIIQSETGSGKTAAFAIPILHQIDWEEKAPQVLVLTPTRELAQQVSEEMFNIGRLSRIKVVSLFGKTPIRPQMTQLRQRVHVVVGTPGRVFDHIERGTLNLSKIKYIVLDEADEMLNMGFVDQIDNILDYCKSTYTMTLLSATMPQDVSRLCQQYMKHPKEVTIESKTTTERIEQVGYYVKNRNKPQLLLDLTQLENPDSCIIFCNTRLQVDKVYSLLLDQDYPVQKLHGGMEQDLRTKVMMNFRKKHFRYLVATDVAARGIDIDRVSLVFNYDLPEEAEVYVHRIGRTGRKNHEGKAVSFIADDAYLLAGIERINGFPLEIKEAPLEDELAIVKEAFYEKINSKEKVMHEKHPDLSKGILKIHINAGKKTKMRAGDIVGTLCSIDGVTQEDIGIINIQDVSTFVEILNNKGNHVLQVLQTKPIKGRLRKVTRANS